MCEAVFDVDYSGQWGSSWVLHFNIIVQLKGTTKKKKSRTSAIEIIEVQKCMAGLGAGT